MNGRTRVSISENRFQRAGDPHYEISEAEYLWRGLTPRQPTNPDLRGRRESSSPNSPLEKLTVSGVILPWSGTNLCHSSGSWPTLNKEGAFEGSNL